MSGRLLIDEATLGDDSYYRDYSVFPRCGTIPQATIPKATSLADLVYILGLLLFPSSLGNNLVHVPKVQSCYDVYETFIIIIII